LSVTIKKNSLVKKNLRLKSAESKRRKKRRFPDSDLCKRRQQTDRPRLMRSEQSVLSKKVNVRPERKKLKNYRRRKRKLKLLKLHAKSNFWKKRS